MLSVYDEFSGIGGMSHGASFVPGLEITDAANHDRDAIEQHANNFPNTRHWHEDVTKLVMENMPHADLFSSSPACFTARTLILTRRGLVQIEDVQVGDEVFTHRRRWRPVTCTMRRTAPTVLVRGVGLASGIETTAEHPFYTRRRARVWKNDIRLYRMQLSSTASWTEAKDLTGHAWATPVDFGSELPVPPVGGRGIEFDADFWWIVGRWLGDGHLRVQPRRSVPKPKRRASRKGKPRSQPPGSSCIRCDQPARPYGKGTTDRVALYCADGPCAKERAPQQYDPGQSRYELTISCGHHEQEDLAKRLDTVGMLTWQVRVKRTASTFTTAHRGLVEWLAEHFGQHAHGKTVPAWALTMPAAWREALLAGYLSADGNVGHYSRASTVSKRLAIGIRLLANSLGHVANMHGPATRKPGRRIEGRTVNERPVWTVTWLTAGPEHAYHLDADGYRWAPVKTVADTGQTAEVYNITVAEDESYLADGITVHNCPAWTDANGVKRDFDKVNAVRQGTLPGMEDTEEEITPKLAKRLADYRRSRLLMHEVIRYLRGMIDRDPRNPVKAGMVENVIQVRLWTEWDNWINEFHKLGYRTRLIALNSMHVRPVRAPSSAQSRNRAYLAYWHTSLGRSPDFDKWLRPKAFCENCCQIIDAVQSWKKPGVDMGSYGPHGQYVYRCPQKTCRGRQVHPEVLPALTAIDTTDLGTRIGDRPRSAKKPGGLAPATIGRIAAGMRDHWGPLLTPVGGTWRGNGDKGAVPLSQPAPTRTTRETDGVAFPPLLVPVEGRPGKHAAPVTGTARTQTTRNETGLMFPPLIATLRGGGCRDTARDATTTPAGTVSAQGNHHGLAVHPQLLMRNTTPRGAESRCTPVTEYARTVTASSRQSLLTWDKQLLVPIANKGPARTLAEPSGTQTTHDRFGLAMAPTEYLADLPDVDDVLFRMLKVKEVGRLMGFADTFRNEAPSNAVQVKLFGNAVVAACAEVIFSALVECVTGETLPRDLTLAA